MTVTLSERTQREQRTLAEDLRLATAWLNEVKADLVAAPEDLELLAEEELLAVLLDRLERASSTATSQSAPSVVEKP